MYVHFTCLEHATQIVSTLRLHNDEYHLGHISRIGVECGHDFDTDCVEGRCYVGVAYACEIGETIHHPEIQQNSNVGRTTDRSYAVLFDTAELPHEGNEYEVRWLNPAGYLELTEAIVITADEAIAGLVPMPDCTGWSCPGCPTCCYFTN